MSNLQTCPRRVLRARKSTAPYLSLSSWAILPSTVIYLAIYSSSQVRSCVAGLLRPLVFHLIAWSWETVQHSKNTWHVKNSESNFNMSTQTSLREACNEMLARCHLKAVVINRFSMKQPNRFTLLFAGSLWTNWCGLFHIFVVRFCNRIVNQNQPKHWVLQAYSCNPNKILCGRTSGNALLNRRIVRLPEHRRIWTSPRRWDYDKLLGKDSSTYVLMHVNKTTHLKQPFQKMFQL